MEPDWADEIANNITDGLTVEWDDQPRAISAALRSAVESRDKEIAELKSQLEYADMVISRFNSGAELQACLERENAAGERIKELEEALASAEVRAWNEAIEAAAKVVVYSVPEDGNLPEQRFARQRAAAIRTLKKEQP